MISTFIQSLFTVLASATVTVISNQFSEKKTVIDLKYIEKLVILFLVIFSISFILEKIW